MSYGPSPQKCSHGVPLKPGYRCDECRIVSLTESLRWMEKQVKSDRAELDRLLVARGAKAI